MYNTKARAQFKINTQVLKATPFILDGLSVAQCRLSPAIEAVFIGTVSVAWDERTGQLAAGDVALGWTSWDWSLNWAWQFPDSFVGYKRFLVPLKPPQEMCTCVCVYACMSRSLSQS